MDTTFMGLKLFFVFLLCVEQWYFPPSDVCRIHIWLDNATAVTIANSNRKKKFNNPDILILFLIHQPYNGEVKVIFVDENWHVNVSIKLNGKLLH